jgi:glycosyltransferase involved in cell wall biosynthesis
MGFREYEAIKVMKLFIFSDTHWSLGRVHRDVVKQLLCEVRYTDWGSYTREEFLSNYNWCDKCIANLVAYKTIKNVFPELDLKKCIFVSHGFVEHEGMEYNPDLQYGMTSDSLINLFPSTVKPFLMRNGVDPDNFNYIPKDGTISNIGWSGADHVWWKQVNWAKDISKMSNIPLKLATSLSYDDVKNWYNTIDLLIVTAVPNAHQETGPLPPFEAIVSGVPVIGTPVGNFRHVPGPKFKSVEEAVMLIEHFKTNKDNLKKLAAMQYEYVMQHYTYKTLVVEWKHALEFS